MSNVSQELIEKIARVTHEANRAWCVANGDLSQPTWDEAPDWQRDSAVDGVKFTLSNPGAGDSAARSSHENWMAHKLANGWTYGDVKSEALKTHPSLVPFDELPASEKAKDAIFRSVVLAIADYE